LLEPRGNVRLGKNKENKKQTLHFIEAED